MIWLLIVTAALVGFAGGYVVCLVCMADEDNYVEYEAEEWR